MKMLDHLRIFAATVAAFSMMGWTSVLAQEQSKSVNPPKNPKELPKVPAKKDVKSTMPVPSNPKSPGKTKSIPGPVVKDVAKPTGGKHNGFDVYVDKSNKKYYLNKAGEKKYLPE